MVADDGATGMLVLFEISLLQPFPLQIKQCDRLLHLVSLSDKQPRSTLLAAKEKKIIFDHDFRLQMTGLNILQVLRM